MTKTTNAFVKFLADEYTLYELEGMQRHGANTGWSGLIGHVELEDLLKEYRDDIWEVLEDYASSTGETVLQILDRAGGSEGYYSFVSAAVWSAAEIAVSEAIEIKEEEEEEEEDAE